MNETAKIRPSHLRRPAVIYVRQSSASQVERNTESTARQYGLASRAVALGWPASGVRVIDDDLGLSGASAAGRSGFAELAAQVASARWAWCWHWRSPAWLATTRTGTGSWTWPA